MSVLNYVIEHTSITKRSFSRSSAIRCAILPSTKIDNCSLRCETSVKVIAMPMFSSPCVSLESPNDASARRNHSPV